MACATAALWMSTSNLVEKITNVPFHTTAEITALAMSLDRPFGPGIGRRGLSIVEMEHALFEMGLDPRRHPFPDPDRMVEICHLFSDSGIPLVLGIESSGVGHAVTVVGYTLGSPSNPTPTRPGMFSAHQFVPYLVIHDDQRGMYLLAEVGDLPKPNPPWSAQLTIHAPSGPESALCTAILVPFPRRVMLDAYEVRTQAEVWIPFEKSHGVIEDRDVVCRKLLVRSNAYKQTLLENRYSAAMPDGYPNELVNFARQLPMPRYVWLIEVSYMSEWDPADPMSPPVIAEFVLDSTLTEARRPDFLLAHYPGTLFGNLVTESGIKLIEGTVAADAAHLPFPDTPTSLTGFEKIVKLRELPDQSRNRPVLLNNQRPLGVGIDSTTLLCPRPHASALLKTSNPSRISRSLSEAAGPGAGFRDPSSTTTLLDCPCRSWTCPSGPSERASVGFRLDRRGRLGGRILH